MKTLVILSLIATAVYGDIFGDLMVGVDDHGNKCIPIVGASPADLQEIMNHRVPTSAAGMCLVACIQKDMGIQSADGKLDKEGTMKSIKPLEAADEASYNMLKSIFEKCVDDSNEDEDECEIGAHFKQCILDNIQ